MLDRDLTGYDLIVIDWNNAATTETLTMAQEDRPSRTVDSGTGLAGWHGAGASFRSNLRYNWLLGGPAPRNDLHMTGRGVTARLRLEQNII